MRCRQPLGGSGLIGDRFGRLCRRSALGMGWGVGPGQEQTGGGSGEKKEKRAFGESQSSLHSLLYPTRKLQGSTNTVTDKVAGARIHRNRGSGSSAETAGDGGSHWAERLGALPGGSPA